MKQGIGILGGAFDPIHKGHLAIANNILKQLPINEVRFIPCKQAVLKPTTRASAQQRLDMLAIELQHYPHFIIERCEIDRRTPSYTVETLSYLKSQHTNTPLLFTMGMDAFVTLPQWYHWQELLELSHLIIVNRKDSYIPQDEPLANLIKQHMVTKPSELLEQQAGAILFLKMPPVLTSSTKIRQLIANGQVPQNDISQAVWRYIKDKQLYL